MAMLASIESSLSVTDGVLIYEQFIRNHHQRDVNVVSAFIRFARKLSTDLIYSPDEVWAIKMREATNHLVNFNFVLDSLPSNEKNRMVKFATSAIALSWAVQKTPSLNFFYINGDKVIDASVAGDFLTDDNMVILGMCFKMSFLFWLAFDQLDSEPRTRGLVRSKLNENLLISVSRDPEIFSYYTQVMQMGMDSETFSLQIDEAIALGRRRDIFGTAGDSDNTR